MKKLFSILPLFISMLFMPQIGDSMTTPSQNPAQNPQNTEIPPMDTTHWITHPVGRYLIDLPPNAEFYWHPYRFRGQYDLVWKKGMTIEQAKKLLTEEAELAKKAPHDINGNQFISIETSRVDGKNILLIRHPNQFSDSYLFKVYFTNAKMKDEYNFHEERVYYYEEQVVSINSMIENTYKFIRNISGRVGPTSPSLPIVRSGGSYFEGGVLYGPGHEIPWPVHEEIGIEVRFPEYLGIEFSIFFDHTRIETEPLATQAPSNIDALRMGNTTVAGNPAQELLRKFTKDGITHYSFTLNSPSTQKSIENPLILMHLTNPLGGVMRDGKSTIKLPIKRPSFKSDEEAMAVWDAIRRSIRWRPDTWKIEPPKEPYYIVGGRIVPYVFNKAPEDK